MRRGIAELIAFDHWLPVPGLCTVDGQHAEALVNMEAVRRATELLQELEAAGAVDADGCS
jgi:hypothetical protein